MPNTSTPIADAAVVIALMKGLSREQQLDALALALDILDIDPMELCVHVGF